MSILKHFHKKAVVWLLAAALVTPAIPMNVSATESDNILNIEDTEVETTENQQEEGSNDGIMVINEDITAPEVDNISFLENGTSITANSAGINQFHMTFDAWDPGNGVITANTVWARVYVQEHMALQEWGHEIMASDLTYTTVNNVTTYTATFDLRADWDGPMQVRELIVQDDSGNRDSKEFYDHQTNVCQFHATIAKVFENFKLTSIVSANNGSKVIYDPSSQNVHIILDDSNHTNGETFTVELSTDAVQGYFGQGDQIELTFRNQENFDRRMSVFYDPSDNTFKGSGEVGHDTEFISSTDKYVLKQATYRGKNINLNGCNLSFDTEYHHTEKNAPVVKDLWFVHNGNRVDDKDFPQFIVTKNNNETLQIRVKIEEESGLRENNDNGFITGYFHVNLASLNQDHRDERTTHWFVLDSSKTVYGQNGAPNSYEYYYDVDIEDLYATEWFISQGQSRDVYNNVARDEDMEVSLGKDLESHYFFVREDESDDGTSSVPTFTSKVNVHIFGRDSIEHENVTYYRTTTLRTLLNNEIPDVSVDGRRHTGWYLASQDKYISLDTPIYIDGNYEELNFVPVYDKALVEIEVRYISEEGFWESVKTTCLGNYGDPVSTVINQSMVNSVKHSTGAGFINWQVSGMYGALNEPIRPDNFYMCYDPEYTNLPAYADYRYIDSDGDWVGDSETIWVPKNSTFGDVIAQAKNGTRPHGSANGFIEWTYVEPDFDGPLMTDPYDGGFGFTLLAKYQKSYTNAVVLYYDKNGDAVQENITVDVYAGDTYGDIYQRLPLSGIEHCSAYGFKTWEISADLTTPVTERDILNGFWVEAVYTGMPLKIVYTYYDVNGVLQTKTDDALRNYDTFDVFDYVKNTITPTAAANTKFQYWVFDSAYGLSQKPNVSCKEIHLAAKYSDVEPVKLNTLTVNNNLEIVEGGYIHYIPVGNDFTQFGDNEWNVFLNKYMPIVDQLSNLSFQLKEYRLDGGFYEASMIGNSGIGHIPTVHSHAVFDEVVLYTWKLGVEVDTDKILSDSTQTIMKNGDTYTLPMTVNGKNVAWQVLTVDNEMGRIPGGTVITLESPCVIICPYEVGGAGNSGGSSSSPGTSTPPSSSTTTQQANPTPIISVPVQNQPIPVTPPVTTNVNQPVELETSVINNVKTDIANAQPGAVISVNMTNSASEVATVVPAEILEEARGKNVTIVLDMGDYSWTINGMDINAPKLEDINLEVTMDTNVIAPNIINAIAGGAPTRQLSLTYNGNFGFKAQLTINVGSQNAGQFGNLYYHDSNNKLVFQNAGLIDANGNVSLMFSHASDYVVIISEEASAEETVTEIITESAEEEGEDIAEIEVESEKENETTSLSILPIILLIVVVIAGIAGVILVKNKKKS